MSNPTCIVVEDGTACPNVVQARGMCSKHYQRDRHHGSPLVVSDSRATPGLKNRLCESCSTEFTPYRVSQTTCSERCRRNTSAYKDAKNAARRIATAKNPKARQDLNRFWNLRRMYNMTPRDLDDMTERQDNRCMICGNPPKPDGVRAASRLHIDHDHLTGRRRDLLCNHCNRGIGAFMDDPELLRKAADYIERHRAAVAA